MRFLSSSILAAFALLAPIILAAAETTGNRCSCRGVFGSSSRPVRPLHQGRDEANVIAFGIKQKYVKIYAVDATASDEEKVQQCLAKCTAAGI